MKNNDYGPGDVFLIIFILLLALILLVVGVYFMDDTQESLCRRQYGGPLEAAHCREVLANDRK